MNVRFVFPAVAGRRIVVGLLESGGRGWIRTGLLVLAAGLLTGVAGCTQRSTAPASSPLVYPETRTVDQVDVLHGVEVADPYRWLEDLDADETAEWVAAQNELTFGWLEEVEARDDIRQRLTELWNYAKYGIPFEKGGRYFYKRNDGLQNQSVLYVTESLDAEPRVLLDPNQLSEDGTVAMSTYSISDDGKLMAYALSDAGSDWIEFHVRNVDTGEDLDDHLKWVKFSGASWDRKGEGFYYSRYDEPQGDRLEEVNRFPKLYYHRIGTPQSEDRLIYHRPDQPDWGFGGYVTEDGRYLIISISKGTERANRISYIDLDAEAQTPVDLLTEFDALYSFVGNDGPVFWFFTNYEAPLGRLIAIDTRNPDREFWVEVIPESEDTLRGVSLVGDFFIGSYLHDAHARIEVFDLAGSPLRDVALPGLGSASGFGGDRSDTETFYAFTSFSVPTTIYRYDLTTGRSTVFRKPEVDFDPDAYVTRQVFYRSKDGTRVPMFITHKRGLALDGDNPTLLYAYGGFNIPLTPSFSISRLVWMEMGGVYAIANVRGGGEYGKAWHDAGKLHNKQNTFDDLIAAGEWLIANDYTRSEKLAILGGSNGGMVVGACITQRPDLFGAAIPVVGVMDMLRFHKFTIGWAWVSDFGSPDDPDDFEVIYAYSPLHNIEPGTCYPAVFAMTADHDDRVVPSHSFKFISAMQAAQACANPILIRIETKAGHGAGKPTSKRIDEAADMWAFLVRALDVDVAGW